MALDPQYKNSLTTFIDVLGFRSLVRTRPGREIKAIIDKLHHMGDVDADVHPGAFGKHSDIGLYITAFSDSVVRVQDAETPGGLFHELIAIVHIQALLARQGVFLRGGVAFGPMFAEGRVLFGDGLIQAYDLESTTACNPRILIDDAVLSALSTGDIKGRHSAKEEREYIDSLTTRDADGMHFVDYLRAYRPELDDPDYDYPEFLDDHRTAIQTAYATAANDRVKAKYEWLADYHNQVVGGLSAEFRTLRIDLPSRPRPRATTWPSTWLRALCRRIPLCRPR